MSNIFAKINGDFKERYDFARTHIKHETVLLQLSLLTIICLAFLLREMAAFQWDWAFSEADCYSQLIAATAIDSKVSSLGFLGAILNFLTYVDPIMWYPNPGSRDFGLTQNLAIPVYGALIHQLFLLFGINLTIQQAAFIAPGFSGTLAIVIIYFLGKEVANKRVGLLAAFFLAISPGDLTRSTAGWFDNEALGVPFMLLTFYFFLRSYRNGSITTAFLGGLSMAGLYLSWGGSSYAVQLIGLYCIILVLLKRYSDKLFISFFGMIIPALSLAVLYPREGPSILLSIDGVLPLGVLLVLFMLSIYQSYKTKINSISFLTARNLETAGYTFIFGVFAFIFIDFWIPIVPTFREKFLSVIIPFFRSSSPITESVAEQLIMTWGSMFNDLFVLVFFIPLSIPYLYKKPTANNIFLLLYMMTALYFSGSMVRLILILAPASAVVCAKVVDEILYPYAKLLKNRNFKGYKKPSVFTSIGKEHIFVVFTIFFLVLGFNLIQALNADQGEINPPTISMEFKIPNGVYTYGDWYQTLDWLHRETPQNSVVVSWWDYGYYLTIANRTIIDDGSTQNTTQIGNVGAFFMSTPNYALKIASYYDIDYILVVTADGQTQLDNDIGKVQWMVKIAEASSNLDSQVGYPIKSANFFKYASDGTSIIAYDNEFFSSLIWAIMTDGVDSTMLSNFKSNQLVSSTLTTVGFLPQYAIYKQIFIPAFTSSNDYIRIMKIDWTAAQRLVGVAK